MKHPRSSILYPLTLLLSAGDLVLVGEDFLLELLWPVQLLYPLWLEVGLQLMPQCQVDDSLVVSVCIPNIGLSVGSDTEDTMIWVLSWKF